MKQDEKNFDREVGQSQLLFARLHDMQKEVDERNRFSTVVSFAKKFIPSKKNLLLALLSSALLAFGFPDFNLWFLAWVGFVPLFISLSSNNQTGKQAFTIGWLFGALFFVLTCYWLTYSMIRYGKIPTVIAYTFLIIAALIIGLIPALFSLTFHRLVVRFEIKALFIAPFCWAAFEWLRFQITGQLWNAIGYSQAFVPELIQTASFGGVYAVSFLIVLVNSSLAFAFLKRDFLSVAVSASLVAFVITILFLTSPSMKQSQKTEVILVALQPNVPMDSMTYQQMQQLFDWHIKTGERELNKSASSSPRLVIFPESPMLFMYSRDSQLREALAEFTTRNKTSLIINSSEPAPNSGEYNSALLIDEKGNLKAQYDKIHLMPFGEYVPVPGWIPGASYVPTMVGNFTAGNEHDLFPIGNLKAGIFICFESAFPNHTREFANNGADVLIEVTNDGYLGPTPVLRQHLSKAVFRAVETNRPVVRVTNAGITAFIDERGNVKDETKGFEATTRTWNIYKTNGQTFYVRHGDIFVYACLIISALCFVLCTLKNPSAETRTK